MIRQDFAELAQVLESARSQVPAPEAHGCLCGALCASGGYGVRDWLEELLPGEADDPDTAESRDALGRGFAATVEALRGDALEFEPLLPDDGQPLATRVEALGQWCQGFLYGFGAAGHAAEELRHGDVAEVLRDLAELSRAGLSAADDLESQEAAFVDLVEFVRVGVQLVYEQLEPVRRLQRVSAAEH